VYDGAVLASQAAIQQAGFCRRWVCRQWTTVMASTAAVHPARPHVETLALDPDARSVALREHMPRRQGSRFLPFQGNFNSRLSNIDSQCKSGLSGQCLLPRLGKKAPFAVNAKAALAPPPARRLGLQIRSGQSLRCRGAPRSSLCHLRKRGPGRLKFRRGACGSRSKPGLGRGGQA